MENSIYSSCHDIPWQATAVCMALLFKDERPKVAQNPHVLHQRAPKKLTEEAVYTICVMLVFVGLVIIGSSITAWEVYAEDRKKNSEFCGNGFDDAKRRIKILKKEKSQESNGYFKELQYLLDFKFMHLFFTWSLVVDVLFMLSGFLNAKTFFENYSRSNGNISWFYFYLKRYVRLTPVYLILLGFYATLFSYTGSGILWPTYDTNPLCRKDWWWHPLYINNFEDATQMCLPWTWSLSVDMQFYVISPLFMVTLVRWPRFGFALILACISGSSITSSLLTYQYNLIDFGSRLELNIHDLDYCVEKFWEDFDNMYRNPFARITPYLVAILLAYYLHKEPYNKKTIRNNKMFLCCGWIVAAISFWLCFFSLHKREEVLLVTALYNGTKHLFCSIAFAWIIYLCITGQLEFLNRFLSWKLFLPFSRLSYCVSMIHPIVLLKRLLESEDLGIFSYSNLLWECLCVFGISVCVSFIASLLFEIPALNLLHWHGVKRAGKISKEIHIN